MPRCLEMFPEIRGGEKITRVTQLVGSPTGRFQRKLAHALLMRHADGFVRQSGLSNILSSEGMWIPPFVVQLVGEYVIEIAADIQAGPSRLDRAQYGSFIRANPVFLANTRKRATIYWNCYYQHDANGRTMLGNRSWISLK